MSQLLSVQAAIRQLEKDAEELGFGDIAEQAGLSGSSAVRRALTLNQGEPQTTVRTLSAIAHAIGYELRIVLDD